MAAINSTNNTNVIVDEFISYATSHLNSVQGIISTVSLYAAGPPPSPVQIPGPGIINWTGYFIAPSTPIKIVTEDDFVPKEDVDTQQSVKLTNEESVKNGTTEESIDKTIDDLAEPTLEIDESDATFREIKFNTGKPFVSGFRAGAGGSGFASNVSAVVVNLGSLDLSSDWPTLAATFIGKNEGFTSKAMWDVNAWRLGFGTDKILGDDGKIRDVLQTDTTTVEAALKMLKYEVVNGFKNRVVGSENYQISEKTFNSLNNKQKAALISYAYNVGSLRVGIANAIKSSNLNSAAQQIEAGPITGGGVVYPGLIRRRKEEATLFST